MTHYKISAFKQNVTCVKIVLLGHSDIYVDVGNKKAGDAIIRQKESTRSQKHYEIEIPAGASSKYVYISTFKTGKPVIWFNF